MRVGLVCAPGDSLLTVPGRWFCCDHIISVQFRLLSCNLFFFFFFFFFGGGVAVHSVNHMFSFVV